MKEQQMTVPSSPTYKLTLSRKWLNEDFVDLSHISDGQFVAAMTAMGHKVQMVATDDDTMFEFEIRNHRPDCCSAMGIAREAAAAIRTAAEACQMGAPVDLAVVDLHEALATLGRITGEQVDERLMDDIFSRFCVGK